MKSKTLIFPYDRHSSPVVRHQGLLKSLVITHAVSPRGWGYTGKDAAYVDGRENTGICVSCDFDQAVDEVDTVLFTASERKLDFCEYIYPKLVTAVNKKKEIICTLSLKEKEKEKINNLCRDQGVHIQWFPENQGVADFSRAGGDYRSIYKIGTPVIMVLGACAQTDKFEIQLVLREKLLQMGYKVSQIGSRRYCELLGFHSFPEFMYLRGLTEADKVFLFNAMVKRMEIQEKPDVIIIGIPEGIMPVNEIHSENFGICAYEVSQAVTPDAAILSLHYGDYTEEYFEKMWYLAKYRLGIEIDCFALTNLVFDRVNAQERGYKCYTEVDVKVVENMVDKLKQPRCPVFNIMHRHSSEAMAEFLVDRLASYPEVQTL